MSTATSKRHDTLRPHTYRSVDLHLRRKAALGPVQQTAQHLGCSEQASWRERCRQHENVQACPHARTSLVVVAVNRLLADKHQVRRLLVHDVLEDLCYCQRLHLRVDALVGLDVDA